MREETFVIYKYNELSDAAKEKAHQNFVESDKPCYSIDESMDSLIDFLKWSGLEITSYQLSAYGNSYINTNIPEDYQEEMRVKEVEYRLLGVDEWDIEDKLNDEFDYLAVQTRNLLPNFPEKEKKHWETGYCMDDDIIHWWNEHLKEHPTDNIGALHAVVDGALSYMEREMENEDSKEYFDEHESEYENEYLEDGTQHY